MAGQIFDFFAFVVYLQKNDDKVMSDVLKLLLSQQME